MRDAASNKQGGQRLAEAAAAGDKKALAKEGVAQGVGAATGTGEAGARVTRIALTAAGILLPVAIVVALIVTTGVVGGAQDWDRQFDTAPPASSNSLPWLPRDTLRAYQQAVLPYNQGGADAVPWTLLAAAGTLATENGRVSPYDNCDRRPGSDALYSPEKLDGDCDAGPASFSEVEPAIVGSGVAGPFLLSAYQVDSDDVNLQVIAGRPTDAPSTSTELIAAELDRIKSDMVSREGWALPEVGDSEAAAKFWTEAVARLPIVTPAGDRCTAPVAATGSRSIMGPPTIPADQVKQRFRDLGKADPPKLQVSTDELVDLYYEEGRAEGVRPDWAIAQTIHETGWYTVGEGPTYNNFAGIGHCDSCERGIGFATPQEGVRAHIQFMRRIAQGNDVQLANPLDATPTWALGILENWDQLANSYASDGNYWAGLSGVFTTLGGVVPPPGPASAAPGSGAGPGASPGAGKVAGSGPDAVGTAIATTWNCTLPAAVGELRTLTSIARGDDGNFTGVVRNPVGTIVDEALLVSWAWSGWGQRNADLNYCEAVGPDAPAGVFPLTQSVFEAYAADPKASRCDASANITAAARAFTAGEKAPPGERFAGARRVGDRSTETGPYNPMVGGWWAMPWALGDADALEEFLQYGGGSSYAPSTECRVAIAGMVDTLAGRTDLFAAPDSVSAVPVEAKEAAFASADPRGGDCPAGVGEFGLFEQTSADIAAELRRQLSDEIASTPLAPGGPPPDPAKVARVTALRNVEDFLRQRGGRLAGTQTPAVAGTDSVVQRLGRHPVVFGDFRRPPQPDAGVYAESVVELATALGGVTPQDGEFRRDITDEELTALASSLRKRIFGVNDTGSGSATLPDFPPVIGDAINKTLAALPGAAAGCRADFALLAAVAYTESGAYWSQIGADGVASPPILGPVLDGSGAGGNTTPIFDTDRGRFDGNTTYDRAVGPYQFIPSTWELWASDANGDGASDPQSIYDQSLAAARYLCSLAGNGDLLDETVAREAVARYKGGTSAAAYALADDTLNKARWYRLLLASTGGNGPTTGNGTFVWPTSGPVTSGFGMRWGSLHAGLDIAPPLGTPITAAAGGTVVYAGWMGGYGNTVDIDHGDGTLTRYAHQLGVATQVGATVAQGQLIGYIGSTGDSTGPHLHFEIRVGGAPQDPLGLLPPR
jgi:murein DD-endopeptidase MepM/ murein hydrolase activator NlpD